MLVLFNKSKISLEEIAMNTKESNGRPMFVIGIVLLILSMAFTSASFYTKVAFGGAGQAAFQVLRIIGLLLSVAFLVFFTKGLNKKFPKGKKTKSGITIVVIGAIFLVLGLWITLGALFNLWGLNNPRGFAAMISVALSLFVFSLGLGYWGYCRATFSDNHKAQGGVLAATN
ncbi:MAG: hypothetical protein UR60_C0032G0007 [Candidatus Moranbacteria bacterium GW2011_GWF2_34_56]|nr:MAG: hypothetical protein UR51_C0013G0007 [Candidatus Moranbacteria bacterium GW2011_GWF1_34_10]KKP63999.1 MAG: hypothetical protein UR60_C0032G0007 [Candidatus Moranbacteria bacterium GW2011_GWF2_34_56]